MSKLNSNYYFSYYYLLLMKKVGVCGGGLTDSTLSLIDVYV